LIVFEPGFFACMDRVVEWLAKVLVQACEKKIKIKTLQCLKLLVLVLKGKIDSPNQQQIDLIKILTSQKSHTNWLSQAQISS
jgi:hypothetical protein